MVTYYIQKTLTTDGNAFGFAGTNVRINLDSEVTKVIENITKSYAATVQRPYSRGNYGNQASKTILIDLKQMKWTFVVTGVLTNDSGNIQTATGSDITPATANTAVNKKNVLIAMAEQGGTMTFAHRNNTSTETINIVSMDFEDIETEVGSSETAVMKEGEVRISFTLTLIKGVDR